MLKQPFPNLSITPTHKLQFLFSSNVNTAIQTKGIKIPHNYDNRIPEILVAD